MKIWHVSDTHTEHRALPIPSNIDMVIFSGDCSNVRNPIFNEKEVRDFIDWYKVLPIQYKIFVAGNHDTSIEKGLVTKIDFAQEGIIYLENETINIEGIEIFGSPYTPTFGEWSFMRSRGKLHKIYELANSPDIWIQHGPPKTILDLSYNRDGMLEFCGCKELYNEINRKKPSYVLFGHIHNYEDINNQGIQIIDSITYSNASCVTDGKFGQLSFYGNIFDYKKRNFH